MANLRVKISPSTFPLDLISTNSCASMLPVNGAPHNEPFGFDFSFHHGTFTQNQVVGLQLPLILPSILRFPEHSNPP